MNSESEKTAREGALARKRTGRAPARSKPLPKKNARTCLLVLGMHRSGTSALTRVLNLMGAALPNRLMGTGPGNEAGHWEPQHLVEYNDRLLGELGSSWHDWRPLDLTALTPSRRERIKADFRDIVEADFGAAPLFVVKDPRICRFAGLFVEALEEAGIRVLPVIVFRNPLEVSASLQDRAGLWPTGYTATDAALLWLIHVLEAVRATKGRKRAFMTYDGLLRDWRKSIERIAHDLQIGFPVDANDAAPLIDDFLSANLRHHSRKLNDVALDPELQGWVNEAHEALTKLAASSSAARNEEKLEAIHNEYRRSVPYLDRFQSAAIEAKVRASRVEADLVAKNAELEQAQAKLTENMEIARQLQDVLAEAARLKAHVGDLEAKLGKAEDDNKKVTAELGALRGDRELMNDLVSAISDGFAGNDVLLAAAEKVTSAKPVEKSDFAGFTVALRQALHDREVSFRTMEEACADAEKRSEALHSSLEEYRDRMDSQNEILESRQEQIVSLSDRIASLENSLAIKKSEIEITNAALCARDETIAALYGSSSWRLTAPLRGMATMLRGKKLPAAEIQLALPAPTGMTEEASAAHKDTVFFTICSRNFIAYARTLHESLLRHNPGARFVVALCDEPSAPFNPDRENFPFVYLDDLALPEWREMSRRYNITEFNTSIKPFVFEHIFEKMDAERVVYLDPDIYVVGEFTEIEKEFASGTEVLLTPHMLEPAENAEMNERRLLQYGIYNLGFLGLRNTSQTRDLLAWWGRRLKTECIIKRDEGLFVDQKWADHFPAFVSRTKILRHPGYNVAYWNLSSRKVGWNGDHWEVNGQPLRFVHFSGNELDDLTTLSRHSSEHTPATIGQLRLLLDEYRSKIYANGHERYRNIPYAFNWYGEAGVNEHTPMKNGAGAVQVFETPDEGVLAEGGSAEAVQSLASMTPKIPGGEPVGASPLELLRTAERMAGGRKQLVAKVAKTMKTGGFAKVRSRINYVRARANTHSNSALVAERVIAETPVAPLGWRKRILVLDWTTPRPQEDSGSRTIFYFIEILTLLGYSVDFLPLNLLHDGDNTKRLERIGVRCLFDGVISSTSDHLRSNGAGYDFVVLNRGPSCISTLPLIKTFCPQAKIIFNTVDLHYIREMREAELAGQPIDGALETKKSEMELVDASAETIVLSEAEKLILEKEKPDAHIRVLPLVFSSIDPAPPPFEERRNILFIGSFPHKPNIDAVLFFADEVFPSLRERIPEIEWHIIGSEPTDDVRKLADRPGIVVHGFVEDLDPIFRSIRLAVAPLRYGAGIKGKIATSLSYGVPTVASPIAVEGMKIVAGEHVEVAETPRDFVDAIASLYNDKERWERMSRNGQLVNVAEYSVPANTIRVSEMMRKLDPDGAMIDLFAFGSKREHDLVRQAFSPVFEHHRARELELLPPGENPFRLEGYCAVCERNSRFLTSYMYSVAKTAEGRPLPNWREHLACDGCGFTMRLRAAMHLFFSRYYAGPASSIYITEQATPLYAWLKEKHANLSGSEYLGDKIAFGEELDGLRNEDLTSLTFPDQTFDTVLSFDVLEHVSDDLEAFRECFRVLKPGGTLFFSAPFAYDKEKKVVRAELQPNGEIVHHLPPEIHGNPVDEAGALCFRYFGWDVVRDLKSAGFGKVEVLNYWSDNYAYLGPFGYLISARN